MLRPIVLIGAVAYTHGKCHDVAKSEVINKTGFLLECTDKGWGGSYLRRRAASPLELKKKEQGRFTEVETLPHAVGSEKAVFCPDAHVPMSNTVSWTYMMTLILSDPTETSPYGSKASFKLAPRSYFLWAGQPYFEIEKTGDVDTMDMTCEKGSMLKTVTPEGVESFHAGLEYYDWRNRLELDKEEMQFYTKLRGPLAPMEDRRKYLDDTRKIIALHRGEGTLTTGALTNMNAMKFVKRI